LIDTPDDWQELGDFFIKLPRPIYEVFTVNHESAKVADTHMFEYPGGWIKAQDLTISHALLTTSGYSKIKKIKKGTAEEVYDLTVNHPNHRYWSGNISSHNSGKSFLCFNATREMQKLGYDVVYYIDTEGAIDSTDFPKFGVDLDRLKYYRMGLISDIKFFVNDLIETLKENVKLGLKIGLIIDSIGQLDTDKTKKDMEKGHNPADMGLRAKDLRSLFKLMTLDLSNLRVPFIFTNHTGASPNQYEGKAPGGGGGPEFAASIILMLSKGHLKDSNKTKTGIIVRSSTRKNRLAKPDDIEFHISFLKGMNPFVGLETYISDKHDSWNNCGIGRGKKHTEKEFSKMPVKEQAECIKCEIPNETFYFQPGKQGKVYVNRYTGDAIPVKELFTPRLFTHDVLLQLDKNVIMPSFKYPENQDGIFELEHDELSERTDDEILAAVGSEE
jgi:RecA/RadA recombinase